MKKKFLKWFAIFLGFIGLLIVGYFVILMAAFGAFDKNYSNEELIENYHDKEKEIFELKKYFESIVPKNKRVEIEFENDKELFRFGVYTIDSSSGNIVYPVYLKWNLKIGSYELDSIMQTINWNRKTLEIIKSKFYKADCIQVDNDNPFKIGFKRSGLCMYSYYIFNNTISDSLKKEYHQQHNYIFFKDNIAFASDCGAVD